MFTCVRACSPPVLVPRQHVGDNFVRPMGAEQGAFMEPRFVLVRNQPEMFVADQKFCLCGMVGRGLEAHATAITGSAT